jgi:hypothetical protein
MLTLRGLLLHVQRTARLENVSGKLSSTRVKKDKEKGNPRQ